MPGCAAGFDQIQDARDPNDMRTLDVFSYKSYLQFVQDFVVAKGHGYKSEVAKATEIQGAYLSRVLAGKAHLNLEQAEKLSRLFLLNESEARYFLTLLERDRAGTTELKSYFAAILEELKVQNLNIKKRLKVAQEISDQDKQVYYSSWLYGAAYVMSSIPKYQEVDALASGLSISTKRALEILSFLASIGLVKKQGTKYVISSGSLHLGKDEPLIIQHQSNWRMRAMHAIESQQPENLHYGTVMALSRSDAALIKRKLTDLIEEINRLMVPSKEEEAHILCVDWFGLG
jgi:uncharacterized protein (TIGR02147 family)